MSKYIIPLFLISFCIFALIIWAVVYTAVKCKGKEEKITIGGYKYGKNI